MDKLSIVPSRAGRREWIGLAVLALPTLLLSLDMSVLYLAMPQLAEDLAPSSTQFLWIMDIYGFLIAGFLVTMGTLGDRIGRRKLLMIGAAAFGIASMLAAYSSSAEMLIVNRALLGIAGATLMPSTLALISNMFKDPGQRGIAISVWMSCFMVGVAIGPLIGGLLLEQFWWGSVFLLGVPIMLLLLIAAPLLLPEYRDSKAEKMDLASVGLFLAAILPIVYGLKEFAKAGALEWQPVALLLFGGLVAVWFVRRQQTLTSPL
ncbi:MFS transporter [Paenibacillus hemerocallicola]|uniref:MFS transporter n=2 Tax=Paenibacillus hemerocallicola TaxID=1172614 RepID=A0A5C4T3P2_9BACL|nr:MFS transporter [Paenibacillus hemerocallicola]